MRFQRSFQRVFPNGFPTGTDPIKHTYQRVCDPTYILKYITAALFGQGAASLFTASQFATLLSASCKLYSAMTSRGWVNLSKRSFYTPVTNSLTDFFSRETRFFTHGKQGYEFLDAETLSINQGYSDLIQGYHKINALKSCTYHIFIFIKAAAGGQFDQLAIAILRFEFEKMDMGKHYYRTSLLTQAQSNKNPMSVNRTRNDYTNEGNQK